MTITTQDRGRPWRHLLRRWTALAVAGALAFAGAATTGAPAAAEETPWLTIQEIQGQGVFARWTVPNAAVEEAAGGPVSQVVARGSFGPSDNWAQVNLSRSGSSWTDVIGPLEPGLYHYQLTADDTKHFGDPTNPNTNEAQPTWRWFYVPGPDGFFLNDVPDGAGGTLQDMSYESTAGGQDRTAVVYTPPGYDAGRAEPYPVFYLQHGSGQSYRDWTELGRARQIFDNLVLDGGMVPAVVVMGNGNGVSFTDELLQRIVPASREHFNVSDDPAGMALAGLSMGGGQSMTVLKTRPGVFGYVGTFGAGFGSTSGVDVDAINDGTTLLRLYTGNKTDLAYNSVVSSVPALETAGIDHEFDGINPDYGHNWNHWQESLQDFSRRIFRDPSEIDDHGMSPGHLPAEGTFTPPPAGTTPTPYLTDDGFATFEAPAEYSSAQTITVWGNFGPSKRWVRMEMSRSAGRWRATVGQLEPGFYYYRLHVDRVQRKDTSNPSTVTTEPTWSTFYVPGDSARLLADAPAGEGGELQVMSYPSSASGNPTRSAWVWTPPGYDADREVPYPVLYLQHGSGQSWTDWVEMGRAGQIMDNLRLDGATVPMVVVMANGNGVNFTDELLQRIVPASREQFNVSTAKDEMAHAGLSMGGGQTVSALKARPGTFGYVGVFAAGFGGAVDAATVQAINERTNLLRFYSGNVTDTTYNSVVSGNATMDAIGVDHEFNGYTAHGHNWDAWQLNLIDFAPRLFQHVGSVSVTPAEPTVTVGWTERFAAEVASTHGASSAVTWSVEGESSSGTTISDDGLLTVGADETASSLRVVATSVFDPTRSGTAEVGLAPTGAAAATVKARATPASVPAGGTFQLHVSVDPAHRPHAGPSQAGPSHAGPSHAGPTPTGEVAVTFGGTVQVVPLVRGKAEVSLATTDLPRGKYRVHVAYSGDPAYAPQAADHQELRVR
ncbi:alpha/beta hydrolase-fold protein [Promicromonospora sp. NPDC050262]|uniref:alpha/beta hydrolase-fold protein n=1 Tax=Promicromonospora sp. NPDC050262 TaxID=3155036 RepID=UPI0033EC1756